MATHGGTVVVGDMFYRKGEKMLFRMLARVRKMLTVTVDCRGRYWGEADDKPVSNPDDGGCLQTYVNCGPFRFRIVRDW